jgi:hypothetical protein
LVNSLASEVGDTQWPRRTLANNNLKHKLSTRRKAEQRAKATGQKASEKPSELTGWPMIAKYLGQPVAVAQRWAKDGMPVQRKGRSMTAKPEELSKWLGQQSGTSEPVHVAQSQDEDLLKELRRGLQAVRSRKKS